MTAIREDLSQRTWLSKSQLTAADICGQKAWLEIHHRRPFIPDEKTTFGSAVDAAVEAIIKDARAGRVPSQDALMSAARGAMERNGIDVDLDQVDDAAHAFIRDILPAHDWGGAELQRRLHVDIPGWGEVDGHPDILLPGAVWDVKTSARMKDTARTVELGLYALLAALETGLPVAEVGYFCWVRTKKPYWQTISTPVTADFRAWTRERVDAYVRARNADVLLNKGVGEPVNWSFPGGPRNGSICKGCQYSPALGGDCRMAVLEETNDD
jgi:hypothetical protein